MLLGISLISFAIMQLAPGNPVSMMMDPKISAADKALLAHNLGLDAPWGIQYLKWLGQLLRGNFGYSLISGQPVWDMISPRIGPTLLLSISTLWTSMMIGIPMGLYSAYRKAHWQDNVITAVTVAILSIPSFWVGVMFILIFAQAAGLVPTSGYMDPFWLDATWYDRALDIAWHMILPLATMVIGSAAGLIRFVRYTTLAQLTSPYVTAARARGFSERHILFRHVLKNTLLPLVTLLGLELPGLLGGAFIIESIFAWPGMGQLGVSAVFSRDYPIIMALLLISSTLMLIGNQLADLAYRWVDPRVS